MASEKQIAANRRNARKSTGPKTQEGKFRSRKNAIRHGLTAETVVPAFENADGYSAFEQDIIADYGPQTAVEYQLVTRLASLLWRLRRAVAAESGILQIHGQVIRERPHETWLINETDPLAGLKRLLKTRLSETRSGAAAEVRETAGHQDNIDQAKPTLDAARAFLRVGNLDGGILDLVLRYETTLARQLMQTMLCLGYCRRDLGTNAISPTVLKLLRTRPSLSQKPPNNT